MQRGHYSLEPTRAYEVQSKLGIIIPNLPQNAHSESINNAVCRVRSVSPQSPVSLSCNCLYLVSVLLLGRRTSGLHLAISQIRVIHGT